MRRSAGLSRVQAERSWLRAYHSVATTRRTSSSCVALKRLHDSPTTCSSSWGRRFWNSAARRSVISSTGGTASMIVLSAGFADLVRQIGLVIPDRYLTVDEPRYFLSGRHHDSLSRYQATVSARPCSNGTCGS